MAGKISRLFFQIGLIRFKRGSWRLPTEQGLVMLAEALLKQHHAITVQHNVVRTGIDKVLTV
ncbi:Uncharacterised protein [Vibrio cholerae]|nr:Uncharacterised protein [Vibrio cholerae]CSA76318.1 Uncharacterised protein [Vibrio cholerae]CSB51334.1 Uncharacterised protein [Vibrio cholerae]CSB67988.1 Uncharacterised protein [Vibrio cholerae]CSB98486.1 Uncharacterised protein [Vibrio cholerae]